MYFFFQNSFVSSVKSQISKSVEYFRRSKMDLHFLFDETFHQRIILTDETKMHNHTHR